jgi:hypothetical protein
MNRGVKEWGHVLYLCKTLMKPVWLAAVFTLMMLAAHLSPMASAQDSSITTSADDHGITFFGEGVLQVVIDDPNADDDSTVEELVVDIDATPDSGSQGSISVTVPETSDSSGRFEFFLVHADATSVSPSDLDPRNSAGVDVDGSCVSDCAPFVTFGSVGDLQVDADLYEDVSFDISDGDDEITVNYGESVAEVSLDRTAYGSDSFVYVFIDDQDANLNPTEADEFTVDPDSTPNDDLLALEGGSIDSTVTFSETGDNTARFEGRYELGASLSFDSESLVLVLSDKANYGDTLGADENDSDRTDEVNFVIGDTDGTVDVGDPTTWDAELSSDKPAYSLGESIRVTIEDRDANSNPGISEDVGLELSAAAGNATLLALETGPNTGIFEATVQLAVDGSVSDTQLVIEEGESIVMVYTDEKPADYQTRLDSGQETEKDFTLEVDTLVGSSGLPSVTMSPPSASGVGGSPTLVAGTQIGLSTIIENDRSVEQPFVALIEVRDSSGITVYLAWQTGNLQPADSTMIGVSWTPEASGTYEVRTFSLTSLSEGLVISKVATADVVIA